MVVSCVFLWGLKSPRVSTMLLNRTCGAWNIGIADLLAAQITHMLTELFSLQSCAPKIFSSKCARVACSCPRCSGYSGFPFFTCRITSVRLGFSPRLPKCSLSATAAPQDTDACGLALHPNLQGFWLKKMKGSEKIYVWGFKSPGACCLALRASDASGFRPKGQKRSRGCQLPEPRKAQRRQLGCRGLGVLFG